MDLQHSFYFNGFNTIYEELGHSCQYGGLFIYSWNVDFICKTTYACWEFRFNLCDNLHNLNLNYTLNGYIRMLVITYAGYSEGRIDLRIVATPCYKASWLSLHPRGMGHIEVSTGNSPCLFITATSEKPAEQWKQSTLPVKIYVEDHASNGFGYVSIYANIVNYKSSTSSSEKKLQIKDTAGQELLFLLENNEKKSFFNIGKYITIHYLYEGEHALITTYHSWVRIIIIGNKFCVKKDNHVIGKDIQYIPLAYLIAPAPTFKACTLLFVQDDKEKTVKSIAWLNRLAYQFVWYYFGLHLLVTQPCAGCVRLPSLMGPSH